MCHRILGKTQLDVITFVVGEVIYSYMLIIKLHILLITG